MRCKVRGKSASLNHGSLILEYHCLLLLLFEVMYFVWIEGRFGGLNLPNNYVPDLLVQGRVEVEALFL